MAGKRGRSGRPKGAVSWMCNPVALAGHHLNVLMEMWLAGVPIGQDIWMWGKPLQRRLLQPTERKHTVPPKIKRVLAQFAIGHVLELHPYLKRPSVDAVLLWTRRRAPTNTLRRQARGSF
jgi:hypothetical protein